MFYLNWKTECDRAGWKNNGTDDDVDEVAYEEERER